MCSNGSARPPRRASQNPAQIALDRHPQEAVNKYVSSVDGNAGLLMEIVRKQGQYSVSGVRASGGGFLTPLWEKVL
jgi:hypothetical protein